jgi:hypothetical protein
LFTASFQIIDKLNPLCPVSIGSDLVDHVDCLIEYILVVEDVQVSADFTVGQCEQALLLNSVFFFVRFVHCDSQELNANQLERVDHWDHVVLVSRVSGELSEESLPRVNVSVVFEVTEYVNHIFEAVVMLTVVKFRQRDTGNLTFEHPSLLFFFEKEWRLAAVELRVRDRGAGKGALPII